MADKTKMRDAIRKRVNYLEEFYRCDLDIAVATARRELQDEVERRFGVTTFANGEEPDLEYTIEIVANLALFNSMYPPGVKP